MLILRCKYHSVMDVKSYGLHLLVFCTINAVYCQKELKLVNVFFRHGARSPTHPYPTDPHKDSWPQGLKQLTTIGMKQAYDLGLFLKKQYIDSGFMEARYNSKQIYARSTDMDRAMMSGYCALTAMFPPGLSDDQMFNVNLGWQSVPLHTEPEEDDILLNMDEPVCPRYDELKSDFYNTEEFIKKNNSYQDFYADLMSKSGQTGNPDPNTAWNVYDTYLCEITNGFTPPAWNTEEMMNTIVTELIPLQYLIDYDSVEKAKLKGGVMVDQIIKNMEAAVEGEDKPIKMFLYSAHDDNVILLLLSLGLYDYTYITYTSAIFYELYNTPEGHKVKVVFKNNSMAEPSTLTVPGCTELCPLETFKELVAPYRVSPEERPQLCSLDGRSTGSSIALAIGIAVAVMLLMALVLFVVLRRKTKPSYRRLSNHRSSYASTDVNDDVQNESTTLRQNDTKQSTSYS